MSTVELSTSSSGVASAYARVVSRIAEAAREVGRDPASVTLVAVTKTFGGEDILPVLYAGQRVFGENRVQEAQRKWPALLEQFPDIELHLIGPLQSNKARDAVALFDVIQSLDRESLAAELAKAIARADSGRTPRFLVQVNTGLEPQKAGVAPDDTQAFVEMCGQRYGIVADGLMCIPPVEENPVPHFAMLARLAEQLGLRQLSMGMSGDYEQAIAQGATMVRVGSAIFGARE